MRTKVYSCKCHGSPYTVCQDCGCQYCPQYWPACPRVSWHPSHATTNEEIGRRARALDIARRQSEANRAAV